MKIQCSKCSKDLGNILSGSMLRNGIVYLCEQCHEKYKILEDLENFNRGVESQNSYKGKDGMPDFLKNMFK